MDATQQLDVNQSSHPPAARWLIEPGWEELLQGDFELPLARLLENGVAKIVKNGAHRTVYRLDFEQAPLFVKHYRCRGLLRRGRHLFRASSARREWVNAKELIGRNLPTASPIALGEESSSGVVGDSFLITRAIEPSVTLDEALAQGFLRSTNVNDVRRQHEATRQLAQLTAALHAAGVQPDDFHGGNLLLETVQDTSAGTTSAQVRLHLIDVPGLRIGSKPLSWRQARRSLVMLTSGFMNRTSASLRWRFWREYVRCCQAGASRILPRRCNLKREAARIFADSRAFARHLLRGRDARAMRDNYDFRRLRAPGIRAHAVRELSQTAVSGLLADPTWPISHFRHAPEKISHGSLVVRAELKGESGMLPVAYKRLRPTRWLDQWGNWLLRRVVRSKSLMSWRLGHALLQRGIATARPIFCLASKSEEYLATEWIPGAENFHLFSWRIAELPEAERDRLANLAAAAMGKLIGRMHWWKIRHRDLKGCNLVLSHDDAAENDDASDKEMHNGPPGQEISAQIIDLDGVRILRWLPYRIRVRDLARLAVSASTHGWIQSKHRQAFLSAYLRASRPDVFDAKKLAADINKVAQRLIRDMRKRSKEVA